MISNRLYMGVLDLGLPKEPSSITYGDNGVLVFKIKVLSNSENEYETVSTVNAYSSECAELSKTYNYSPFKPDFDREYLITDFIDQYKNKTFIFEISEGALAANISVVDVDLSNVKKLIRVPVYPQYRNILTLPNKNLDYLKYKHFSYVYVDNLDELAIYESPASFKASKFQSEGIKRDPIITLTNFLNPPKTKSYQYEDVLFVDENVLLRGQSSTKSPPPQTIKTEPKVERIEPTTMNQSEQRFIETLKDVARKEGLFYTDADLVNFHTALKTGSLVILGGISGTGKSRLVDVYRKALGLPASQYKMLAVSPAWSDESDILGYATKSGYSKSPTGLVDFLLDAQKNPNQLYMVCFDEMNLAKVEHYFNQFISLLERVDERKLALYTGGITYDNAPKEIELKNNILFVGTVNFDETTNAFSDKVLDRSNLIELSRPSFKSLKGHRKQEYDPSKIARIEKSTWDSWLRQDTALNLSDSELEFFDELNKLLLQASEKLGIGNRILYQISSYLNSIPDETVLSRRLAFDIQLKQRVLPKIRGTEALLTALFSEPNFKETGLSKLFDKHVALSPFEVSRKVLEGKMKELKDYGFTY